MRGKVACPRLRVSMAVLIAMDWSGQLKLLFGQYKLKKKSKIWKYQEQWENKMFYELWKLILYLCIIISTSHFGPMLFRWSIFEGGAWSQLRGVFGGPLAGRGTHEYIKWCHFWMEDLILFKSGLSNLSTRRPLTSIK